MGQKINPIIFRQGITRQETSKWIAPHDRMGNLQFQDFEIRNFLNNLLRSHGILLRSSRIFYSSKKTFVLFFRDRLTPKRIDLVLETLDLRRQWFSHCLKLLISTLSLLISPIYVTINLH